MTEVNISSLKALNDTIREWKPDCVVSAVGIPAHGNTNKLLLANEVDRLLFPVEDIFNAQLSAYKDLLRIVLMLKNDRILIHCLHGKSRSGALAVAKLYQTHPTKVEGFLKDHPEAEPNPLILLLADEILDTDGAIVRLCKGRYKGCNL